MKNLFKSINKNLYLVIPYLIFLMVIGFILVKYNKADIHIFLNNYHNHFSDLFYKYFTHIGDGIFVVIISCVLLIYSFRISLFVFITYLTSGLVTQLLKRFVFVDMARPLKYFESVDYHIYTIQGVEMRMNLSFPSGHATTAFALFFCFALISKNNLTKLLMFVIAILVAYSRVYLSQHFLVDIYFGSVIGVVTALVLYSPLILSDKKWLDGSIIKLMSKNESEKDR